MNRIQKPFSLIDRLTILFFILLALWPVVSSLISISEWKYAIALEKQKHGDLDGATEIYEQIIATRVDDFSSRYRLAEISIVKSDFNAALEHLKYANSNATPNQKFSIANLQANTLLKMEKGSLAVKAIKRLLQFSKLPPKIEDRSIVEFSSFLIDYRSRQILNSIAYVSAIGSVDLADASKYIDAVIMARNADEFRSLIAIPALYERAGEYDLALDSYLKANENLTRSIENLEFLDRSILKLQKRKNATSTVIKQKIADLEFEGKTDFRRFVAERILLLAKKTNRISSGEAAEKFLSEFGNSNPDLKFDKNDNAYLEIVTELHHYLDTRAVVRFEIAKQQEQLLLKNHKDDSELILAGDALKSYYSDAEKDMVASIECRKVIEAYHKKFPINEPIVLLPIDEIEKQRFEQKTLAVEYYHYAQILDALEKPSQSKEYLKKIVELGFEPNNELF